MVLSTKSGSEREGGGDPREGVSFSRRPAARARAQRKLDGGAHLLTALPKLLLVALLRDLGLGALRLAELELALRTAARIKKSARRRSARECDVGGCGRGCQMDGTAVIVPAASRLQLAEGSKRRRRLFVSLRVFGKVTS